MANRQEMRSEETKQAILTAAGELFARRGFESVSMREIAKAASCSHTTIYIYFKDKEALLHQLAKGPLEMLKAQMDTIIAASDMTPDNKLKHLSQDFIRFCLTHANMYDIFFMTRATRVDDEAPDSEVNRLRLQLFKRLRQAIQTYLQSDDDEYVLSCARIYFFLLHGIVGTYYKSDEPVDALMIRLEGTFNHAIDVILTGFKKTDE